MFRVNNRNIRTRWEIGSKLTIKTPEWTPVFIVKFEQISHLALVFLVLTLSRWMPTGLLTPSHCTKTLFISTAINGEKKMYIFDMGFSESLKDWDKLPSLKYVVAVLETWKQETWSKATLALELLRTSKLVKRDSQILIMSFFFFKNP